MMSDKVIFNPFAWDNTMLTSFANKHSISTIVAEIFFKGVGHLYDEAFAGEEKKKKRQ